MARIRAATSASAIWSCGGVDSAWDVVGGMASAAVFHSRMGQCPGVGIYTHADYGIGLAHLGSQSLGLQHSRAYADACGVQRQFPAAGRAVPRPAHKTAGLAILLVRGSGRGRRGHFVDTRTPRQSTVTSVYAFLVQ